VFRGTLLFISFFLSFCTSCLSQAKVLSSIDDKAKLIEQRVSDKNNIITLSEVIPCFINDNSWGRISWIDTSRAQILKGMSKPDCNEATTAVFYFVENRVGKVEISENSSSKLGQYYFESDSLILHKQSGGQSRYDYKWVKSNIQYFYTRPQYWLELRKNDSLLEIARVLAYQLTDSVVFEIDSLVGPIYGRYLKYKLSYDGSGNLVMASKQFEEKKYYTRFYFKSHKGIYWESYTKGDEDVVIRGTEPHTSRIGEWPILVELARKNCSNSREE